MSNWIVGVSIEDMDIIKTYSDWKERVISPSHGYWLIRMNFIDHARTSIGLRINIGLIFFQNYKNGCLKLIDCDRIWVDMWGF